MQDLHCFSLASISMQSIIQLSFHDDLVFLTVYGRFFGRCDRSSSFLFHCLLFDKTGHRLYHYHPVYVDSAEFCVQHVTDSVHHIRIPINTSGTLSIRYLSRVV